jgi:hypothetical protein
MHLSTTLTVISTTSTTTLTIDFQTTEFLIHDYN